MTINYREMTRFALLSAGLALTTSIMTPAAIAADFTLNFDEGVDGQPLLYKSNGTLETTQWAQWGLNDITGISNRPLNGQPRTAQFNTYDTNKAGGRDNDLLTGDAWGTTAQGNVLIIQEELSANMANGKYLADDEALGGKINFDFAEAVAFTRFSMLDIDDNGRGIRVKGFNGGQQQLDIDIDALINEHKAANGNAQGSIFVKDGVTITQLGTKRGDNSMYQFDLSSSYFSATRLENIEFTYPGSGAIAGLQWRTDENVPQEIPEPSVIGGLLMLGFVGTRKRLKR